MKFTDDPSDLRELLDNHKVEVVRLDELSERTMMISYVTKREWVEEAAFSNVVLSLWTTSAARLHLLKSMQQVVRTPGCRLLYTDTDSLIFLCPKGKCPLKTGFHLGDLT